MSVIRAAGVILHPSSFILCCALAMSASAQQYPVKPIRLVVTFAPGGTTDIQARMLLDKLVPRLGQQVVLDHRGGAGGNIGMEVVARSPADGYTLVITTVGTWSVNPHLYKLAYDVQKDFAPVIHVATTPGVLVVHPSVPAKSVRELVALARKRPGELTYGTAGVGSFTHVSAELFGVMTGTKMTHVPYKGSGPVTTDLIGGHLQLSFSSAVPAMPQIQSGRLRALATTGSRRLGVLPDLPTVAEAGVTGYESSTWTAIAAPARTPPAVVERLNREIQAVLQMPDVQEKAAAMGSVLTGGTPEWFRDFLASELAKYGKLVKQAGIRPEAAS
jgi:tripartite-type tricarboxylate transporter receptor subunit TctC